MKKIFILTLIILGLFCGVSYAEGTNLVKNPGFEESDSPYFWNQYIWENSEGSANISVVSDVHHEGNNCAKIVNSKENDTRLKQSITVEPSTIYKISAWVKTENVGTGKKGANLSADMLMETSEDVTGTSDWRLLVLYGRTGADQKTLILTAGLGGYGSLNTGTMYLDDVSVELVTDLPNGANVINLFNSQAANTGSTDNSEGGSKSWLIILAILCVVAIAAIVFFIIRKPATPQKTKLDPDSASIGTSKSKDSGNKKPHAPVFKIDRKDLIIMGVMTLVYLIIALVNLGDMSVPETFWKPTTPGEGITVKFDREYEIGKIGYYNNIGDGKYSVKYKNSTGKYLPIGTMNQDVYNVIRWGYLDNLNIKTNEIKITVDAVTDSNNGPALSEITFYEKGSKVPIKGFSVEEFHTGQPKDKGSVKNLFDEQDKHSYTNTYMNSSYFDEIYHPRTAFENLHRMEPYETTHPPLGKAIMAIGVWLFGMTPFGWRIMGTLFGAAMIPAMYLLGKKMFNKRIFGFISAFLMMFDCMHFAQTRIGTIDSYPGLFVILTYYFMYDVFMKKSYKQGFKQSLKPLLLAGIFWALGSASKWTAVYAAFGIAVLFIVAKVLEIIDYNKATNPRVNKGKLPLWTKNFYKKNIVYTCLCCVIFFIIIPVIIYTASYLPIITLPGPGHDLNEVVRYQENMFSYHADLTADHPFMSKAWQWPLNYKPLLEYRDSSLDSSKLSYMYVMGNPFIFWFGLLSVFMAIVIGLWKRDKRVFFLAVALGFQYLPWFPINRCLFIYHFFTSVPFLIMFVVYILKFLHDDLPKIIGKAYMNKGSELTAQSVTKVIVYLYLALVALMFFFLYPAISGYVVDSDYLNWVRWLNLN